MIDLNTTLAQFVRPTKLVRRPVPASYDISLRDPAPGERLRRNLVHLAVYSKGNAGDHLLTVVLRDLFDHEQGRSRWHLRSLRALFEPRDAETVNRCGGVVIGGGGLFLRDTNANLNSGWQWNCPIEELDAIRVPIVVFAVGYNRFRGQPDFEPVFREHVTLLARKSVYMGLRNSGSIRALRGYLPEELHGKLRFQPCMTTLLSRLYPRLVERRVDEAQEPIIALNIAFDRAEHRFGERELDILLRIGRAMKVLSSAARIHLVQHSSDDDHIMPFLRAAGVPVERVDLRVRTPAEIVQYYAAVNLVIGARGHAQMIPFGCGTPILSVISHEKLGFFLEDIGHREWGVDVQSDDLESELVGKAQSILAETASVRREIERLQQQLWEVTSRNVAEAMAAFDEEAAAKGRGSREPAAVTP